MKDVTKGVIHTVVCYGDGIWVDGYQIGVEGVTKITREIDEAVGVPYIHIWKGRQLFAEINPGAIAGIYYQTEDEA